LELVSLRGEKNSSHALKRGYEYLLGVLSRISDKYLIFFTCESPLGFDEGKNGEEQGNQC